MLFILGLVIVLAVGSLAVLAVPWAGRFHLMTTGRPASGPTQREDSAWKVITFVCHMPRLSAEERQRLLAAWGDGHRAG